mgnify:CR=1 FL=1
MPLTSRKYSKTKDLNKGGVKAMDKKSDFDELKDIDLRTYDWFIRALLSLIKMEVIRYEINMLFFFKKTNRTNWQWAMT